MTMPAAEHDDFIGRTVLRRYRIVHRLASGGMGVIYLARSEGAKGFVKPVVIKRILPSLVGDEAMVGMFAREARIMSNLSHPGIVGIVDFEEEEGAYLMVLEYVHGFHLGRWNRFIRRTRGLFPVEHAIHLVISVLDALHYAHKLTGAGGEPLNIVHRDVSPGNVLIDVDGRSKLTDFGIARMRTDMTSSQEKGHFKGTFSYMAPELLKMAEPSPRSDLYSCAVVLHELLVGKNEFSAQDLATTAYRVLEHPPSPVDEARPDAPPGLRDVLSKALSKSPDDRYEDAFAFAQELRRVRGVPADDVQRLLAEAAAKDFSNPELARRAGVADLATLESRWRNPPKRFSVPSFRALRTVRPSDPSTRRVPPAEVAPRVDRLEHRKGLALGLTVGIVAAGGLAAALLLRHRVADAPAPSVILVEGSVAAVGVSAQALVPVAPGTAVSGAAPTGIAAGASSVAGDPVAAGGDPATAAGPAKGGTASSPRSKQEALTRAFARQEPQIARCFTQHASNVTGNPEVSVRFEVGTDGRVAAAQVQPSALAATPLGDCIAKVAQKTQFGPQPQPLSFRIPITARRGP
jgi:serine/threonine-protein kinase